MNIEKPSIEFEMNKKQPNNEFNDCLDNKKHLYFGIGLSIAYLLDIVTLIILIPVILIVGKGLSDDRINVIQFQTKFVSGVIIVGLMIALIWPKFKIILKDLFKDNAWGKAFLYVFLMHAASIAWRMIALEWFGIKDDETSTNQELVNLFMKSSPFIASLFIVVLAPLVEELIFRYFIFNSIRVNFVKQKTGIIIAAITSIFLFAFIHIIPGLNPESIQKEIILFPQYLIPSIILTLAYVKDKKLAIPLLTHILFNGLSILLTFASKFYENVNSSYPSSISMLLKILFKLR